LILSLLGCLLSALLWYLSRIRR